MAYVVTGSISIDWIGPGSGQTSPNAQVLTVNTLFGGNGGPVPVPGGSAPTTGNVSTAVTTLATNLAAALNANIGQIQGFASGGG